MKLKYENQNYTAEWIDTLFSVGSFFGGKKLIINDSFGKNIVKRKFTYGQWFFQHDSPNLYKSILDDIFHPENNFTEDTDYLDLDELKKN